MTFIFMRIVIQKIFMCKPRNKNEKPERLLNCI